MALRLGRSDILTRTRQPAEPLALIDTEVLVRPIASPDVIADQLRHLLRMSEWPNVTIQLVGGAPGYNPMPAGPFILLEFATATPIVHLEHYRASAFLWEEDDIRGFVDAAQEVHDLAMTPEASVEVIRDLVNGMEDTPS